VKRKHDRALNIVRRPMREAQTLGGINRVEQQLLGLLRT
jgi:hypothetical protein